MIRGDVLRILTARMRNRRDGPRAAGRTDRDKALQFPDTTDRGTCEIAVECGFHNSGDFYRLFRKPAGESTRGLSSESDK